MTPVLHSRQFAPWMPWLCLLALCSLLQLANGYPLLRLDIRPAQWSWLYSIFTSHLVHLNARHWLHNAVALLIIASVFARQYNWISWLVCLLVSAVCVSLGILLFHPQWHSYAGLSGLLHGWFSMGCLLLFRQQPRLATGLGLLVLVKVLVEQLFGPLSQTMLDFPVVGIAHVYGVIGGVLSWVVCYRLRLR